MTADSEEEVGGARRKKKAEEIARSQDERSAKTMADNETENQGRSGNGENRYALGTVSRDTLLKLPFAFRLLKRFNAHSWRRK